MAQIRTESATCATTAHGRRRVQTLAAPTMICATNSASAMVERRTSMGCLSRGGPRSDRRPEHEEHRDRGERSVEEHRRGGAAERGDEPPVHQGPVREHELGVARPTYVPTSRRSPTTAAVSRAPAARRIDRAAVVHGVRFDGVSDWPPTGPPRTSRRRSGAARRRSAPSPTRRRAPWRRPRRRAPPGPAPAGTRGPQARAHAGSRRATRIAARPVSAVSTITRNAIARCENSISEWTVPEGKRRPGSQAGQVEHPRPEPVPRTSPPIANSTIVAIAVASARERKRERVTGIATHA